jgi:hypothetical protein
MWNIDPKARSVIVPASVTNLTSASFPRGTAVEILEFAPGSTISELQKETFHNCASLKSIYIPASVVRIESFCFPSGPCREGSPLETITFERKETLGLEIAGN